MNQLMRVNDHVVVWAVEDNLRPEILEAISEQWSAKIGRDPMIAVLPKTQIVVLDGQPPIFQFSGDISPTMVAEFQRWWEEINA